MTGLGNAEVMRAAYDVGIRQVISDASAPCEDNPSPNAGYYNALVPNLLQIPRRATDLYFNVSQQPEWIAEYEALRSTGPITYDRIIDIESTEQLRYLMRGESDPWMFHQANLRDLGGGHSLLTSLLDAVLAKYEARSTFPVVSPTMDELAQKVKTRMAFDASGVSATIAPGGLLTVQVTRAATVPVTGLCTAGAETYAGQTISYLPLADGQSVTLSLADCNADFTPPPAPAPTDGTLPPGPTAGGNCPPSTGTAGTSGADGAAGGGGSDGTGGAGGSAMGSLSTDGSPDPGAYGGGGGCGCALSPAQPGGAGSLLLALITAAITGRLRRRSANQASWAMRPSLSGRSIR
jgi:hypothetical protein